MELGKYSFGTGDRFAMQGQAQLKAIIMAVEKGIHISPVWNKSYREHKTIGSKPEATRKAADEAVKTLGWSGPYFLDADHINLNNVDMFTEHCNFFTIDVADYIGKEASDPDLHAYISKNSRFLGNLQIPGIDEVFKITPEKLREIGGKFLFAIKQASVIYKHILKHKKNGAFVTEISMDEVQEAQSPVELFFILSALAEENIPVATIAPKFTGRFNKGVDYAGDIERFEKEFEQDLMVIDYAINMFSLPATLKLSVHSGSDKFSIYPVVGRLIKKHDKGIHVKTAGTTWLEEAIGLSLAGGEALEMIKKIYKGALSRFDELAGPYATVIDINPAGLPTAEEVSQWTGLQLANALRHIPGHPEYNPNFRQLMHVSYKLAAEEKNNFTNLLAQHNVIVGHQVTENLYDRHIRRLFDIQ